MTLYGDSICVGGWSSLSRRSSVRTLSYLPEDVLLSFNDKSTKRLNLFFFITITLIFESTQLISSGPCRFLYYLIFYLDSLSRSFSRLFLYFWYILFNSVL